MSTPTSSPPAGHRAHREVAALGHRARGAGQGEDRPRDGAPGQAAGEKRDEERGQRDRGHRGQVAPQALPALGEVVADDQGAHRARPRTSRGGGRSARRPGRRGRQSHPRSDGRAADRRAGARRIGREDPPSIV